MEREHISMQSEQINELAAALSKVQGELEPAIKDGTNPAYAKGNNPQAGKFNSLTACWKSCRDTLAKNGLAVIQTSFVGENDKYYLLTTLVHSSGQYMRSITPLLLAKNDSQSYGAAMTYFRRFSLCAIVGISPEDDDGAAERKKAEEEEAKRNIPRPNKDQVNELHDFLDKCSPKFVNNVTIALQRNGWQTLDDMSLDSFNVLYANAKKESETVKPTSMDEVIDQ